MEKGTVLFGPGQKELVDALLGVPMDRTKWDLVDAAGLAIRSLPVLQGESQSLPREGEISAQQRAAGYAARITRQTQPPRSPSRQLVTVIHGLVADAPNSGMRRAAGRAA